MTVAELTARITVIGGAAAQRTFIDLTRSASHFGEAIRTAADATRLFDLASKALVAAAGIKPAFEYDQQVRALAAYQKSAKDLEAQLARMKEIAKLPGIGLKEVRVGVLGLEAAGVATKNAEDSVREFANALALAGRGKEDLGGVLLQLTQIAGQGRLSGDELRIMRERVPSLGQALYKAFGTTNTKQINEMNLGVNELISRITTALASLPRATTGAVVTLDNFIDRLEQSVVPVGRGIIDMFMSSTEAGNALIDQFAKLNQYVGEVLSALGNSGVIADSLDILIRSFGTVGKSWQKGLAIGMTATVTFVAYSVRMFRAMVDDLQNIWNTFWYNAGVPIRNAFGNIIAEVKNGFESVMNAFRFFGNSMVDLWNQVTGAKKPRPFAYAGDVSYAEESRRSYFARTEGVMTQMTATMGGNIARVLKNLGPQKLPAGLNYGGPLAEVKPQPEDSKDKRLRQIEVNTRKSADALELRTQTLGGGRLGRLGVTGTELAGMGMRTTNDLSRAKPISSDSMINRGIKLMIQNNLSFAVNGGRSAPVR